MVKADNIIWSESSWLPSEEGVVGQEGARDRHGTDHQGGQQRDIEEAPDAQVTSRGDGAVRNHPRNCPGLRREEPAVVRAVGKPRRHHTW